MRRTAPVSGADEQFAQDVLACVTDLNAVLPTLSARYEDLVIIAALAEHVGGALRIGMQAGICNPQQAARVLKHIKDTAFSRATTKMRHRSENGA